MQTFTITGVEIFSVGRWNGDEYTNADLNSMVEAFYELKGGLPPYVKLGHDKDQKLLQKDGLPSAGWIERLYIRGDKLIADFEKVPKKIYELIQGKAYRKVSSEIFWNLKVGEKTYSKVLAAVALLGANTPGVGNLSDILGMYNIEGGDLKIHSEGELDLKINLNDKEGNIKMDKTEKEIKLEVELAQKTELTQSLEAKTKEQSDALKAIEKENEDLKKFKIESEAREAKAVAEAEVARLDKFTTELVSEKLCTPGMKPLIQALLGPEQKEYSIKNEDKETKMSKEDLVKESLKLFKAAAEVNFEENSFDDKKSYAKGMEDEMDAMAKKYAAENKCSYGQAMKEVMKKMKKK